MVSQSSAFEGAVGNELESLLVRVERSATHYEVLGLSCSATGEEIKQAYQGAINLLHPSSQPPGQPGQADSRQGGDPPFSSDQMPRIDRAFDRVSLAFSVLANVAKRADYDHFVVAKPSGAGAKSAPPARKEIADERAATQAAEDNRRRTQRFSLRVPAQVVGYDRKNGKWEEMAETINASRTGLRLRMRRRVRHGAILHLAVALPPKLRNHGHADTSYNVYALVRRVEPCEKGARIVGLEYVGEHPPMGYLDKPWATFQTKKWGGKDRRRKPREQRSEVVWVEYFTESMQCIRQEAGKTEDVSEGGMRVAVKSAPSEFELVKVTRPERGTESFAEVCNRFFAKDGLERLCLKYLDNSELVARTSAPAEASASGSAKQGEANGADAPPNARANGQQAARPAKVAKILVADDDPPLRKVIGKILTTAGYQVILVEDGQAAVEKARAESPDLVITDGLMPKMHGFLVCKAIKEMPLPPKVVMITAVYTKMQYKWEAKQKYGADDLLTKPFEVSELLACIEKHLSAASQAEAAPA